MFKRLEAIAGIVASILLFVLMLVTFVDVMGRDFFGRPLVGASEITELALAAIVFLLLPTVAFRQQHIAVDLIDGVSNATFRFVQRALGGLLGAIVFGLMSWRLWLLAGKAAGYADATPSLGIPLAPVLYVMAVFAGLTALGFFMVPFRRTEPTESVEIEVARRVADADTTDVVRPQPATQET